jgi:hypothetical protein
MTYSTNNVNLEPAIPDNLGNAAPSAEYVLWDYFWQGYRYSETRAHQGDLQNHKTKTSRVPKVASPEFFHGDREKYSDYVSQLHLCFHTDPERHADDNAKLAYAASYLRGAAKRWFTPHVDETSGKINFENFEAYLKALKEAFDDPDAAATAERKLRALRQGPETCSTYYSKFLSHMTVLGFDEKAKISWFRNGLSDAVKDLLVGRDIPSEFTKLVTLCIALDNAWRARQAEKHARQPAIVGNFQGPRYPTPVAQVTPTTASGSPPGPMDLSAAKRGPLTKEQKAYRRANNLCLYCAEPGHYASGCPSKLRNGKHTKQRVNATISGAAPEVRPTTIVGENRVTEANASILYSSALESKN